MLSSIICFWSRSFITHSVGCGGTFNDKNKNFNWLTFYGTFDPHVVAFWQRSREFLISYELLWYRYNLILSRWILLLLNGFKQRFELRRYINRKLFVEIFVSMSSIRCWDIAIRETLDGWQARQEGSTRNEFCSELQDRALCTTTISWPQFDSLLHCLRLSEASGEHVRDHCNR